MKLSAILTFLIISMTAVAQAETIAVSRFESEGLAGWEQKSFKGETEYRIVSGDGNAVLEARSRDAASGMFRKIEIDPGQHRYLRWRWKVAGPLQNRAERTKAGDDYSARVYVVFPGFFFWQMKAITYVWASRLPVEEAFPNPYTRNAMMVVVESGPIKAGTWQTGQRDILADYRRLFGGEPRKVGAIAVMTDTDNAGGEAVAWYGDITLSSTPFPAR